VFWVHRSNGSVVPGLHIALGRRIGCLDVGITAVILQAHTSSCHALLVSLIARTRGGNRMSIPSLPFSRKKIRDKEVSLSDVPLRNENGPGKKKVTGSAEFVADLELADEVEKLPQTKRPGAVRSDPSVRNDAAGNFAQVLKGVEATAKKVPVKTQSKQAQTMGLQPATKHFQKLSTSKPPSNAWSVIWEDRLSELANYRKIHGHCNILYKYSKNYKLAQWVVTQRTQYRLQLEGKRSPMTIFRIQELESLGFEWDRYGTSWEDRLSELADYHKIQGHCNVPYNYSENPKLYSRVTHQRLNYRFRLEGKSSPITPLRIQELENLGFVWVVSIEKSFITLPRIQALGSLSFEWKSSRKEPGPDDARRARKKPANSRQGANPQLKTAPPNKILRTTGYH
jgi:hypothetical protein